MEGKFEFDKNVRTDLQKDVLKKIKQLPLEAIAADGTKTLGEEIGFVIFDASRFYSTVQYDVKPLRPVAYKNPSQEPVVLNESSLSYISINGGRVKFNFHYKYPVVDKL